MVLKLPRLLHNTPLSDENNKPTRELTRFWDRAMTAIEGGLRAVSNGLVVAVTGSGEVITRTLTAGVGISITNGDGISGNPTIALGNLTDGHILIGNATNVPTDKAVSGDATLADTGALTLANSGVTAATYGDASHVAQVTFDVKGRATNAGNVSIAIGPGAISLTDTHILVGNATGKAADVAMSGDATISDTGALIIGNTKVTLAKIQNAAASSKLIGSGASGSGASYVEISLGGNLTMTGTTLDATAGGISTTLTSGRIIVGNATNVATAVAMSGDVTIDNTGATVIGAGKVTESKIGLSDVTTDNVTSSAHGFAPKSPADATKFLNGAATVAYAQVKDSDLSTSDITTNDVSTSKHGFAPKGDGDATKFLNAGGTYTVPSTSAGGALSVLASTTTTGNATAISFTSISGAHADLVISIQGRCLKPSAAGDALTMQFNSDSNTNYNSQLASWANTVTNSISQSIGTSSVQLGSIPASTAIANYAGQVEIVIQNYAATVFNKTFSGKWTHVTNDLTGDTIIGIAGGLWKSTAAITRIDIATASGSGFVNGTVAVLYARG